MSQVIRFHKAVLLIVNRNFHEYVPERFISDTDVEIQTSPSRMNPLSVRFEGMLVESINPTTLTIDWCPVLNSDSFRGYKVRYAMKDMSSYNEIFVSPGISNYTITGLRPNTEYVISVYAVDENEAILRNCGFGTHKTDEIYHQLDSKKHHYKRNLNWNSFLFGYCLFQQNPCL